MAIRAPRALAHTSDRQPSGAPVTATGGGNRRLSAGAVAARVSRLGVAGR